MSSFPEKKEKKRGALSDEERELIRQLSKANMSVEEIAETINRGTASVLKFINEDLDIKAKEHDDIDVGTDEERIILKKKLATRHYWLEVKNQVSRDELHYFVESWISYMLQFGEDFVFAEEMSLKDIIMLDILINRNMTERNLTIEYIKSLQKQYDQEIEKDFPDGQRLGDIEDKINIARSTLGQYTQEHTKLLTEKNKINRDLKATRDQRKKVIEDSNTTFSNYMKWLDDEENRSRIGQEVEMMKVAKNRAKERLSELHIYGDGRGDLPILTADTYLEYKKRQNEDTPKETTDEQN